MKEIAADALLELVEDPSPFLKDLIRDEPEYFVKLQALETGDRLTGKDGVKADLAVEALRQGLLHHPNSVVEAANLHSIRLNAVKMLSRYRTGIPETSTLLEELIYRNYPVDEKLTAIEALGNQDTEKADEVLVKYLEVQNNHQANTVSPEDYRIIITTIQVLGDTGNPAAVEELTRVLFSGWTPAISRKAEEALAKLD